MIKFIQEIRGKNPKEKRSLTLKSFYAILFCMVFGISGVNGQVSLTVSGSPVSINFSTSVSGVCSSNVASTASSAMMASTPAVGQLDADAWAFVKDGATSGAAASFPGSLSADFTTVTAAGSSSTGWGMYNISSDREIAIFPSTAQATPGSITLLITNNTGVTLNELSISYNIRAYNDQARSNKVEFWYSATNAASSYTESTAAEFASTAAASNSFESASRTVNLTSLSIANNSSYYIRWFLDDNGGTGSRDEFFLDDIIITGTASSSPTVIATGTLTPFISAGISTPSTEQTFNVSGTNLTNNITITPPTGFQVSTTSDSGFVSSVVLNQSGGTVASTTVYARFNPSALANQVGGNITCVSTGATTQNVAVSGEVTNLSAGALAFIAFQGSAPDIFRMVALEDIPEGTRVQLTDKSWDGSLVTPAFTATEVTGIWTAPSGGLTRGTVIAFDADAGTVSVGTGGILTGLGSAGEQLFAYQGTLTTPTFIAGFTSGSTIASGVPSGTQTWVPTGLTSGTNYIALGNNASASSLNVASNNRVLADHRSFINNSINWTTATSASWPAWTFTFLADEPTTQPSFTAASNVGNNQMDLNFSGGNGTSYIVVMREGSAVSATPTDATNYSAVSGSVNFSSATELSAGQRIVYNGTTSTGTVTVTNLSPGTTYHYAIYAYNGTTTTANFNLTSPGTGNQLTTGSANSNASDIIVSASFTEPSDIAYASNQENANLTAVNSIEVAQFTLRDGGATTDGDANSTTINSITFTISNHVALRRLALYDGSTELGEVAIGSGTATFSGLTLAANDNSTKDFSLRASFAGTIADNTQFSFTVSSVTANISGSTFAAADAGAAVTSTTANRNKIEVTATLLAFVQNTSNVSVLTAMSPAPTVSANDALGNRDLDYVTDMEVTTSGTFAGAATTTETPIAGLATFDNLQFQDAETGINIAVSSGALTPSGNSNDFDITTLLSAGDIAIIGYGATGTDKFAFLLLADVPATTELRFTDNAWTGTNLNSNENTLIWTSPASTLLAGTIVTITSTATVSSGHGSATGTINGLAGGGDQVICYRGTSGSPTFIAAFSSSAWLISGTPNTGNSYLPSGLIAGVTASNVITQADNMYYNNTLTGPVSILRSLINNTSNWITSASSQTFPSFTTSFTTTSTLTSNATVSNVELASGETLAIGANTLTINGAVSGSGTITGGTTSNLTIGGSAGIVQFTSGGTNNFLRNLTLNSSSSLTIGNALNIAGGATAGIVTVGSGATLTTNGNLTLKSDASGTASIGNSAGSISGNVTVERFIPRRRAFRFLASPVNTTNFISGSWQQVTHITGSLTGANGFDQSNSGTASLFTYNVGTEAWTAIPNTNATNLNIGTGYRMLVRGDRNINLNTTTPQDSAALVLSATGSIVTGNVVFGAGSVSSSPEGIPRLNSTVSTGINGWALIGNPYASAVNWANVTKSNVSTSFATWNVNNAGRGAYVYNNGSSGTGNGNSNIINSGQSIFVQTTAANPSITFTEASKVSSTPPSHFKKSISDLLNIDIFIGDRAYDGLSVMFDANNSNDYDVQDFIKLVNPEINFYSYLADGTKLAMNSMKEITSETIVPLGLNGVFNGGSYELKFSNQNTFNNSDVYLKDKFLKQTHDLKSINNLTFTVTADSNSFGENRFELIFSKSATGLNNELSSNNNNFIVFPNPVNNVLNLSLTTTKEDNYSFTIFNQLGEMINTGTLDFNAKRTHALNIENLNNGVYFIQVKNGKSTQAIKFIK